MLSKYLSIGTKCGCMLVGIFSTQSLYALKLSKYLTCTQKLQILFDRHLRRHSKDPFLESWHYVKCVQIRSFLWSFFSLIRSESVFGHCLRSVDAIKGWSLQAYTNKKWLSLQWQWKWHNFFTYSFCSWWNCATLQQHMKIFASTFSYLKLKKSKNSNWNFSQREAKAFLTLVYSLSGLSKIDKKLAKIFESPCLILHSILSCKLEQK